MSFLTCFSSSSLKYPNFVSDARFEESISGEISPRKKAIPLFFPLNLDIVDFIVLLLAV